MRGDEVQDQQPHGTLEGVAEVQGELAHQCGAVKPAIGIADAYVAGGGADAHATADHRGQQLQRQTGKVSLQ